jgi:hypothetical protein
MGAIGLDMYRAAKPQYDTMEVKLRLNFRMEEALRFLLCDLSGIAGLKSTFGAQMDALANASSPGMGHVEIEDGCAITIHTPERWLMNYSQAFRTRVRRAYQVFQILEAERGSVHGLVLFYLYGEKNRTREWDTFGEFAQVAHLTRTAQSHARKLTAKLHAEADANRAYRDAIVGQFDIVRHEVVGARASVRDIAKAKNKDLIAAIKVEADHMVIAACSAFSRAHKEVA